MNTRVCTLTAVIVLGMSLSACSGSSTASSGGAPPATGGADLSSLVSAGEQASRQAAGKSADVDTCKLITRAEAAKALGEPVHAGEHSDDSPSACDWWATKEVPVEGVDIDVLPQFDQIYSDMDDAQVTAIFDITKVSGLGDKAFTQSSKGDTGGSGVGDYLAVKKGDVTLSFSIIRKSMSKEQGFAADKVLARAALGRL